MNSKLTCGEPSAYPVPHLYLKEGKEDPKSLREQGEQHPQLGELTMLPLYTCNLVTLQLGVPGTQVETGKRGVA